MHIVDDLCITLWTNSWEVIKALIQ